MNRLLSTKHANRIAALESLEHRLLLDSGLGSEIAEFASQEELKTALIDRAVAQHEWMFGQEVNRWSCFDFEMCIPEIVLFDLIPLDPAIPGAAPGGAADPIQVGDSFSETNTQVAGVDEGDLVETDGDYVYILSDSLVTIVDVRDTAHPRVASRVKLDPNSNGIEMYLDGDRLMVLSSSWYYYEQPMPLTDGGGPGIADIGFGAPFFWAPSRSTVVATVIDVSNREDATIVSRNEIDGSLANSRAIDGTAYVIVNDYLSFPTPSITTTTTPDNGQGVQQFYETEAEYRVRIASTILDVLPATFTYDADGQLVSTDVLAEFDSTYRTTDPNFGSLVSVVTIDMHATLPSVNHGTTVMMDAGHEIFMSLDNLYLFQTKWGQSDSTSIMKFDVNAEDGSVAPVASGIVPGRMLDQFSADERNGQLRIATTSGFGANASSGVYVLDDVDEGLTVIGSVDGLAPGEQIFSARFLGPMAYVVTFRQVDPLFAISLAEPENPIVLGELKIPGFSEYLQPIDENHLLAIGRDADPITGRADALQLSLFDVTDATAPQLVDRYTFEGELSTYSIAEHDHHAFAYFSEFNTLAIPVSSNDGGAWIREDNGDRFWIPAQYNENLQVFKIDVDTGFTFAGAIEHPSQVRRGVRVNDALISVSFDTLKVNSISNPKDALGQVYYLPPKHGGVVPLDPSVEAIDRLFVAANTTANEPSFDLDGNTLVNKDDVSFLVESVLQTKAGDTDLDNDVDFRDFLTLAANFGKEGGWAEGDFDGDGRIAFADFTILANNFGQHRDLPQDRFRAMP